MVVEVGPEIGQLVFEICRRPEPPDGTSKHRSRAGNPEELWAKR
jgi:hypothetical protein